MNLLNYLDIDVKNFSDNPNLDSFLNNICDKETILNLKSIVASILKEIIDLDQNALNLSYQSNNFVLLFAGYELIKIKDEGLGERKNDSNNDRINHMTFSMMSLANIYVVLGWYDNFDKKTNFRITNQIMEANYINKKIDEIFNYKASALEWNNYHFKNDFVMTLETAASRYEKLSIDKKVAMHPIDGHHKFLKQFQIDKKIDMKKFADNTIPKSYQAALRETKTIHKLEKLNNDKKAVFSIKDLNNGKYYLTCDEIEISEGEVTIIEAKNTSQNLIPSSGDIEDGIFKLLLFKNLSELKLNNIPIQSKVQLNLTGKLKTTLELPNNKNTIIEFASYEELKKSQLQLLLRINSIAHKNQFKVMLFPNE